MFYSNLSNPRIFQPDETITTPDAEVELRSGSIMRIDQDMQIANALRGQPSDGMSIVGAGDELEDDEYQEYPGPEISGFVIWVIAAVVMVALFVLATWLAIRW